MFFRECNSPDELQAHDYCNVLGMRHNPCLFLLPPQQGCKLIPVRSVTMSTKHEPNPMPEASPQLPRQAKSAEAPPISRMRQVAQASGITLRSTEWRGWHEYYLFECERGHLWLRSASKMTHSANTPCAQCLNEERLVLLKALAGKHGGHCLEERYLGRIVPHRFVCAQGHVWQIAAKRVTSGRWCPQCTRAATSQRKRIAQPFLDLQALAHEKGGVCLSKIYNGVNVAYEFQCAQGHRWETSGAEVLRGAWCRLCSHEDRRQAYRLPAGLKRLQEMARSKAGECLSDHHSGQTSYYLFRCERAHEWSAMGQKILLGSWCPICTKINRRLGIGVMQEMAHARGGCCLSEEYLNNNSKLAWQCHRGHTWHAIPSNIRKGHWCPQCAILARIT